MRSAFALLFILLCSELRADFITRFNAYLNTGPQSQIAVQNTSESWSMVEFRVDWCDNAVLGQPDKLLSPGIYGLSTEVTSAGLSSMTLAEVAGQSVRFTFSGMEPGNGAGLKIPIGGGVRGGDIDGTRILATFELDGRQRELEYVFRDTPGSGVSFNVQASVPEPTGLAFIPALSSLALLRRRKS